MVSPAWWSSVCVLMLSPGKAQYDLEVHVSGHCGAVTSAENAGLILKAALKIMRGESSFMASDHP